MREGVQHLSEMRDPEFRELCRHLHSTGGDITPSYSKVNLKVDGCSLRLGKCEGEFFIESSRSGMQTVPGAFSEFTKRKRGVADRISVSYDTVLWALMRHKNLQDLLERFRDIKMFCELLYTPLGVKNRERNTLRFLVTEYDEEALGRLMTLVFYKVEDLAGYPSYDEDRVFGHLKGLSDGMVKILDQRITFDTFKVGDLAARALGPEPPYSALKREMTERILSTPFTHPLKGKDFEGLVFYVGNHIFKATTKSYREGKKVMDAEFKR
jgi:hypothetical protein